MIQISKLFEHLESPVTLKCWVHAIRSQKRMQFLVVRDATGKAQCVLDSQTLPEVAKTFALLTRESTIEISGRVVENPQVELGGLEIQVTEVSLLCLADAALPIDLSSPSQSGVDPRMDWRFLDLRRPENRLIFEIQTETEWAMRAFWRENAFMEIYTPKLMATASESGSELFEVGYFGQKAYLAQSPQF